MRLDVVAENPLESIASSLGLLPASVVKVVWGFTMARTLLAAAELGVFAALGEAEKSADELADELSCDTDGMRTLLNALNGFGLLKRSGGRYTLKKEGRRYLAGLGDADFVPAMRMGALLDRKFQHLAEAVKTGKRPDFHSDLTPDEWSSYLEGLGAMAAVTAGEVVRKVKLDKPQRMLDVAGGHGRFSMAFCKRYDGLTSEILDLEGGAAVGQRIVAKHGMQDRVRYRACDLREAAWGEGHDLVLLFNILHNLREDDAKAAVAKALPALKPGGRLLVLEGQHAGGTGNLNFQAGFGEVFFWMLSASETWPEPTLKGWMESAGFVGLKRRSLLTLPGAVLLEGRAPG